MLIISLTVLSVVIASMWDLKTNRIPNLITLPAIGFGIILNTYFMGLAGLGNAFFGFVLGVLLLILPFIAGGMGAGDVKLLAAIGALNGYVFVFQAFLYSAIAGGGLALLIVVFKGKFKDTLLSLLMMFHLFTAKNLKVSRQGSSGIKFPYGVAFLAGTVATYWSGW